MNGLRSVFKLRKLLRCDIKCRKKLDFGGCVLYLCYREVRLHLSIAFESQLSLLCIRLALTLLREVRLHLSIAFESQLSSLCIRLALTLLREVRLHLSLTDEKTIFLIYSAFFDILLQQKVGQAGLSETHVYGVFIKKLPEAKWEASGRLIVVWHLLCHYYLVSLWLVIGRMTWHCICE